MEADEALCRFFLLYFTEDKNDSWGRVNNTKIFGWMIPLTYNMHKTFFLKHVTHVLGLRDPRCVLLRSIWPQTDIMLLFWIMVIFPKSYMTSTGVLWDPKYKDGTVNLSRTRGLMNVWMFIIYCVLTDIWLPCTNKSLQIY